MSINDVITYSKKYDFNLSDNETKIIYEAIKNDWYEIIFKDHTKVLDKLNINTNLYEKLNNLIKDYKNKYSELLK